MVELSRDVLREAKFRKANPGYDGANPCVYVGMTGLSPEERFDKHKAGIKSFSESGLRVMALATNGPP